MKVAIITPVFPPYFGGIGQVAFREATGLARLGNQITVFTPLYRSLKVLPEEKEDDYKIKRIKPYFQFSKAAWLPQLSNQFKDFDLIHLHYPFIGATSAVLKFKKTNPQIPLIATYHMDLTGRGWKKIFFKFYSRITLPKLLQESDKIIVSSLDYAQNGQLKDSLASQPQKFVEMPFGIDTNRFQPRSKPIFLLQKYGLKNKDKIILFVGALDKAHYFKGVDILLKSFQKLCYMLPHTRASSVRGRHVTCYMLIVGDGDLRPYYEKQARALGVANKVIFADRVAEDDLPFFYNLADVFVLPSQDRSEAYGLVLLEAMAAGVPVIASDLPGVRTNVSPERGILVKPGDAEDLARALSEILSDEEKRKQMGERAREWVRVERAVEKEIEELDKIIKNAVK